MSAFSDDVTAVEVPVELPTRPASSSACSIFSAQADSIAANARFVEEYLSSLELFESQDPRQPAVPATAPETAEALPVMDVPVVAVVSTSSQTDQKDQQHGEAQTVSPALEEPSEHLEPRKELEQRDEEAQTESPMAQDSKETQTVQEQSEHPDTQPENQSQPVDAPPAVELQEAQTQTENQTAQDSKETQTTSEDRADLEHPTDIATAAMEETLKVDADAPALATSGTSAAEAASQESAWMTRVHQLREQESPSRFPSPSSPPDPDVVAKRLGIETRAAQRGPVVPPLDFGKVQMGEVGIYDFSVSLCIPWRSHFRPGLRASMSKARSSELTRASSDGRLGPAFTEPLALSNLSGPSSVVVDLTPEERYQLFVRRIRQKHLGMPKVSPFARPLTLAPLKDHFAFKKKRKSPEQSYFSPGDAIGILASPMEEQLHSHFHHHFHLRNDLPAISAES